MLFILGIIPGMALSAVLNDLDARLARSRWWRGDD